MKINFTTWGAKLLIAVAALTISLTSCDTLEEGDGYGTGVNIVGTWKCNPNQYGDYDTYTFYSNGTMQYTAYFSDDSWEGEKATYVIIGCEIIFTTTDYGDNEDGWQVATGEEVSTYSEFFELDGDTLTMYYSDEQASDDTLYLTIEQVQDELGIAFTDVYQRQ